MARLPFPGLNTLSVLLGCSLRWSAENLDLLLAFATESEPRLSATFPDIGPTLKQRPCLFLV